MHVDISDSGVVLILWVYELHALRAGSVVWATPEVAEDGGPIIDCYLAREKKWKDDRVLATFADFAERLPQPFESYPDDAVDDSVRIERPLYLDVH